MLFTVYPESLKLQEGDAYFLFTWEYFLSKLDLIPSLTSWLEDFLFQFYRWPLVGAIIHALVLGIATLFCLSIPRAFKRETMNEMALLLPVCLIYFFTYDLGLMLESMFFMLFLWLYAKISSVWVRLVFAALSATLGFGLMCHPIQILLLICMALFEWFHFHTKYFGALILLLILAFLVPQLYSQQISFLPLDGRFLHIRNYKGAEYYIYIGIYVLTLFLVMIPVRRFRVIRLSAIAIIALVLILLLSQKEKFRNNETYYYYMALTDEKDWDALMTQLRKDGLGNSVSMKYSLLVESAKGSLGENLFSYSINNPEDFLYRRDRTSFPLVFNRQFYATLGIYDEAMHQAMEYSLLQVNGNCFSAMRNMADYCIEEAEFPVARKYLSILDKSLLHGKFVSERMARIKDLEAKGVKPETPLRKDNFVGGYPFNSEMVRQAQEFPENQGYIDYLLCGLLLQKKLNFFQIIIHRLPYYKQHPLPKAYAEAAAMVEAMGGKMRDVCQYPVEYDEQFKEYMKDKESDSVLLQSKYANSYWNYYFFMDIPAENEQMIRSSRGHG